MSRRAPRVKVHLVIKGRIGEGWYDVDRALKLPEGTTIGQLIEQSEAKGIPLAFAIENSPHLAHTMMLNGERCPVEAHRNRELEDGDELYLLAPLAGG